MFDDIETATNGVYAARSRGNLKAKLFASSMSLEQSLT